MTRRLLTAALWLWVIGATALLLAIVHRGGLHLVVRSVAAGLLLVVLVPVSQFVTGLVLNAWDWAHRHTEGRAPVRLRGER